MSRTPHGVRGLKQFALHAVVGVLRRTPHGARGLKHEGLLGGSPLELSHQMKQTNRIGLLNHEDIYVRHLRSRLPHHMILYPPGQWT